MACLGRLVVLVLLLVAAAAAWVTRDRWWPGARDERAAVPRWERLTPERAQRARVALDALRRADGPVFASLTGGEAASYVFLDADRMIPGFADSAEAAVIDDRLVVRATVPLREVRGLRDLGPLASMLNDHEPVQIAGRMHVPQPGKGELTVTEVKVRDFRLPNGVVNRLITGSARATPSGGPDAAIAVPLPPHIGDIRVGDGRITLYKNVP